MVHTTQLILWSGSWHRKACVSCNLSHIINSPTQTPTSISLALCSSCLPQCVSVKPYPTSQSNSRCSCPSIHSSISSLFCRSLRLYLTVSLPSLRCVGSSVLSTAWNITLAWVLGSDAMAATASGEPWKHTGLFLYSTHRPTAQAPSFCTMTLQLCLSLCCSCGLLFPHVSPVFLLGVQALSL